MRFLPICQGLFAKRYQFGRITPMPTTRKKDEPAWEAAGRFDKLLKEQGFKTHVEVAERLGVSDSTVNRWRSGDRAPSADWLAHICRTLGLSADEVLGLNVDGGWPSHEATRTRRALRKIAAAVEEIETSAGEQNGQGGHRGRR